MLHEIDSQVCEDCGATFRVQQLPSLTWRVFVSPDRYVAPDVDLYVTCPSCGTRQLARNRRFFAELLGPRSAQVILYIFGVVFLTFILLAVLDGLGIVKLF